MPVLNNNSRQAPSSVTKLRKEDRKSDLLCRIKFNNTLPDVPFEPKFVAYPFDSNRFTTYKPTSLEQNHKWELLTENDIGVRIDLIDPDVYKVDLRSATEEQHLDDLRLLEDEAVGPQSTKRSQQHSKFVPWMRKTEYLASEFNRFGTQTERQETKVGYNIKKVLKEETLYKDRESQIQAINKTFEDVQRPVTEHCSKPGVTAVQEMHLFPDFDLWKFPFAQVIFDADPAPIGLPTLAQTEKMSSAVIRGMMDESGEQFVAYFLPTDETQHKRKRDEEEQVDYHPDESYDYKLAREYNWTVKNKASKGYEENYFFVFRDGAVYYNELETRVRLSRRRAKEGLPKITNSRLVVKHRDQNAAEINAKKARLSHLQAVQEEVDEDEDAFHDEEPDENGEEHAMADPVDPDLDESQLLDEERVENSKLDDTDPKSAASEDEEEESKTPSIHAEDSD